MAECDLQDCRGDRKLPNRCNFCGGTYCVEHRLPESHACDSIGTIGLLRRRFEPEFIQENKQPYEKTPTASNHDDIDSEVGRPHSSQSGEDEAGHHGDSQAADLRERITRDHSSTGEPEPIESPVTMGTTPDPDYERSPDVAPDGRIRRDKTRQSDRSDEGSSTQSRPALWKLALLVVIVALLLYISLGLI